MYGPDRNDERPEVIALLATIKERLPELEAVLEQCSNHWGYEDPVYRFYHHSFKVYQLQDATEKIRDTLQSLAPDRALHPWFLEIVNSGLGKKWEPRHNSKWLEVTRPIVEAFFHARYFLQMAVTYGKQLSAPPSLLPSGWAALLYLYELR